MDGKSGNVGTVEADTALLRHDFAAEQTNKRSLAGPVRTNDCVNFVRSDIEHDRICGDHTAEAPGQALSLQKRSSHNYERLCGESRPTNCRTSGAAPTKSVTMPKVTHPRCANAVSVRPLTGIKGTENPCVNAARVTTTNFK